MSLPNAKLITTNCQKLFSKLKLVLHVPAKKFKEIVKIDIDPHKILDNFLFNEELLGRMFEPSYYSVRTPVCPFPPSFNYYHFSQKKIEKREECMM